MVTELDLTDVHGIDVKQLFLEWLHGEFAKWFAAEYPGLHITLVILDPARALEAHQNWNYPEDYELIAEHIGENPNGDESVEELATKDGGTHMNVRRKLRFVLRNPGLDSVDAEDECAHLVLPGDFPYEGAGSHEELHGGVSGLAKDQDWKVLCMCIEKLKELVRTVNRAAAAKAAELRKLDDSPVEVKYLEGIELTVEEVFPDLVRPGDDVNGGDAEQTTTASNEGGGDLSSTDEQALQGADVSQ